MKLKGINYNPLYHGFYGGELGQRLYDFYIPEEHKYVEITGYNKGNYHHVTGKHWISYLRNIVLKKKFALKRGAEFEFIQYDRLSNAEKRAIRKQCINISL